MSPRCALPEHLNDKEEIENAFPDDSQYGGFFGNLWKRWNKMTKAWDAWGYRCPAGIAFSMWPPWILLRKWRKTPFVMFAVKGKGPWRIEKDAHDDDWVESIRGLKDDWYLTRVQLWCRWHIQIQWPLFFCFHWYKKPEDVIPAGAGAERDGKLVMGYIGAKRDADGVFWYVAAYFGMNFK